MAKVIMVQGTMSNAGKSLLVAGLCRIFKQDGYRVAPFKSQNMALNSYITKDGLEMGRAQVMQAEAAGIEPSVFMNPILLKPTDNIGSQVIVNGEVLGNMKARDYFSYKKQLVPHIKEAFRELEKVADIIVIEGAGSPAEINLKENDIVNMGLAEMVDAPVILVGDIDRGGVFAQLYGTVALLEEQEKARIKGLVINKFRGDKTILDPGIEMIEDKSGLPVVGVIPYMYLQLEDEDSLSERFAKQEVGLVDIAVIRLPRISNFTDFDVFEQYEGVSVRYVSSVAEIGNPDLIILPGTKNTIADLKWLRESGIEARIKGMSRSIPIFGICGGYQMLGEMISDPLGVEGKGSIHGMGLLPLQTELEEQKVRRQTECAVREARGIFSGISGKQVVGYEIHMGKTQVGTLEKNDPGNGHLVKMLYPFTENENDQKITGYGAENIYGTYVHGFFDQADISSEIVKALAQRKGLSLGDLKALDYQTIKEQEYDKLADTLREYMDMEAIYRMLQESNII